MPSLFSVFSEDGSTRSKVSSVSLQTDIFALRHTVMVFTMLLLKVARMATHLLLPSSRGRETWRGTGEDRGLGCLEEVTKEEEEKGK